VENRLPTGPGSRGGQWHNPEYRRSYYRRWKHSRPDYQEREARRKSDARRLERLRADAALVGAEMPTFTEALVALMAEESTRTSHRQAAFGLMLCEKTVRRWVTGERTVSAEGVDAIIAVHGMDRVLRTWRRLRRDALCRARQEVA